MAAAAAGLSSPVTVASVPRRNRSRRSNRASSDSGALGVGSGWSRVESTTDGDWMVRNVPGSQATKWYRCPGCDHEIRPGVAHVVAWPSTERGSVQDRRHWHSGCWNQRAKL